MRARASIAPAHAPSIVAMTHACVMAVFGGSLLCLQAGCTALLGSSGLQDMLSDTGDASTIAAYATDDAAGDDAAVETNPPPAEQVPSTVDPDEALEAAMDRLDDSGRLDEATRVALETAIRDAPRQDWPPIIDAFVATIESTPRPQRTALRPVPEETAPATEAAPATATESEPLTETSPAPEADRPESPATAGSSASEPPAVPEPPLAAEPPAPSEPPVVDATTEAPPSPALAVAHACFASKVRGWGAVDRFSEPRFLPGQEVIVYFELEHLSTTETAAGHSTRIDTTLQLVAADGSRLHAWQFEPVAETCPAPRRDYFARYVLRMPAAVPPGPCRLDVAVTDMAGRCTATTSLPLEIIGR